MELEERWCDNTACPDYGKVGAGNLKVFSYVERRYYCVACQRTSSAAKHTFFETIRSPRATVLEALALLTERNSLRAVARLTRHSPNRVLHWLARAGQHGAAVSAALIRDLPLTPVQIDALWTFVKKKPAHRRPEDPADVGDAWIWRALALPRRLRGVSHLSHDRSDPEARAFLAKFKARTDGRAPFCASDQLPADVAALIANYSAPEPPPVRRGPGRPRKEPRRLVDPDLRYAQVQKRREGGGAWSKSSGRSSSAPRAI